MARPHCMMIWTGVWTMLSATAIAQSTPQTEATATSHVPRTLRDGTAASRLPTKAEQRARPAPRTAPTPSIKLDARPGRDQASGERRNEALLQREIALLKRLIANTPIRDSRRADALLRLSYAYQDLMWLQKVRLHELGDARGQGCGCATRESMALVAVGD